MSKMILPLVERESLSKNSKVSKIAFPAPAGNIPAKAPVGVKKSMVPFKPSTKNGPPTSDAVALCVDFRCLSKASLHKYIKFHGVKMQEDCTQNDLTKAVTKHFAATLHTNDRDIISSFITFIHEGAKKDEADHMILAPSFKCKTKVGRAEKVKKIEAALKKTKQKVSNTNIRVKTKNDLAKHSEDQDPNTQRYCVCKGDSYGRMIACDNPDCSNPSNWYHLSCVGINGSESSPEIWYCPQCCNSNTSTTSFGIPECNLRKPALSPTYSDMISNALRELDHEKGSFKDICDIIQRDFQNQLNWKLESDIRKTPVWKSSVRKILFSNRLFVRDPNDRNMFRLNIP